MTIRQHGERQAVAILEAKKLSPRIAAAVVELRESLEALEDQVREIQTADDHEDLKRIMDRLDRLWELWNMMEIESWLVTVDNRLTDAWRRLP